MWGLEPMGDAITKGVGIVVVETASSAVQAGLDPAI